MYILYCISINMHTMKHDSSVISLSSQVFHSGGRAHRAVRHRSATAAAAKSVPGRCCPVLGRVWETHVTGHRESKHRTCCGALILCVRSHGFPKPGTTPDSNGPGIDFSNRASIGVVGGGWAGWSGLDWGAPTGRRPERSIICCVPASHPCQNTAYYAVFRCAPARTRTQHNMLCSGFGGGRIYLQRKNKYTTQCTVKTIKMLSTSNGGVI